MKDLKALLTELAENFQKYIPIYGNITKQSIGAVQRSLLAFENQGANIFFQEPMLDVKDFIRLDYSGKGVINILCAQSLFSSPKLYSTFLLWLMSELFEVLPEVGDLDKPKMVFFFDEAHLLFNNAQKAFVEKIEQCVRLIRSKGVGIYFITQKPVDIPETIAAQLANRIQHSLRAFTTKEIKAIKLAASTFRQNPNFDTSNVITELKVGEALISCLNEDGQPDIVQKVYVRPSESFMGVISDQEYQHLINSSPMEIKYRNSYDRESAFKILSRRIQEKEIEKQKNQIQKKMEEQTYTKTAKVGRPKKTLVEKTTDSLIKTVTTSIGRELVKGLFGILKRK